MSRTKNVFAKCGVNCSLCPWSRSVRETMATEKEYQQFKEKCKRVLGYAPSTVYQNCVGCQTPDEELPRGARIPRRNCLVRQCVDKTRIINCAYCSRFPCEHIKDAGTEWSREKIEATRGPIADEDYDIFVEPFEGLSHLKAVRSTLNPEDIVEAVTVPPLKTKIVDFPDLGLPEKEVKSFKAVYNLLTTIKRSFLELPDADTYAQQQRLKGRIPYFLRFLWIFGRYGELKEDGRMVIDATSYLDNRGKEKQLATLSFVKEVIFKYLAAFGVHCEHVVSEEGKKKGATTPTGYLRDTGWFMVMSFDNIGVGAVKALQTYTAALDKMYGKKAFQHFKNVDMRVLA